jgi:hypothetical protein
MNINIKEVLSSVEVTKTGVSPNGNSMRRTIFVFCVKKLTSVKALIFYTQIFLGYLLVYVDTISIAVKIIFVIILFFLNFVLWSLNKQTN